MEPSKCSIAKGIRKASDILQSNNEIIAKNGKRLIINHYLLKKDLNPEKNNENIITIDRII